MSLSTAWRALYDVSRATVYRSLAGQLCPKGLRRSDRGEPRKMPRAELERYCEIIAALKLRTSNLKGRRLSTRRCIELLEEHGVENARRPGTRPGRASDGADRETGISNTGVMTMTA